MALAVCKIILGVGVAVLTDASPATSFVATSIGRRGSGRLHHYPNDFGRRGGIQFLPNNNFQSTPNSNDVVRQNVMHTHLGTTTNARQRAARTTHLACCAHAPATPTPVSNIAAAGSTLILSSLLGMLFEKKVTKSSGGHVITLTVAALLSNSIAWIPPDHFFYDWCWSVFLPASLVFALLSSPSPSSSPSITSTTESSYNDAPPSTTLSSKSEATRSAILGMALPFVAGSIGSILGCVASFAFVSMLYANHVTALLAGCLCASYIGGTVNFFATAKLWKDHVGNDAAIGSAFGSMAAADLVVMALYFAMLSAVSKSSWLHRLFPSKLGYDKEGEVGRNKDCSKDAFDKKEFPDNKWSVATAVILASSMAIGSVRVATRLEQTVIKSFPPPFNPPGTMCAFLACFGSFFEWLVRMALSSKKSASTKTASFASDISLHLAKSLQKIPAISPSMSNICFYLLFAAVGTTADLTSAVAGGPAALAFALLALIVHSSTVVVVTWTVMGIGKYIGGYMKPKMGILREFRWQSSSWEEVLTASNAAIGGPSTAGAFAAGLIPNTDDGGAEGRSDRNQYRSALVIAATFWGVLGYAIGTGVGITVSRVLMSWR